ncbi:MAG TPA: hypothetical protein VMW89_06410 [Desulfatiglandales bacterium]|nr:hypothetical protein [Desulfatiglandales bacterium]
MKSASLEGGRSVLPMTELKERFAQGATYKAGLEAGGELANS